MKTVIQYIKDKLYPRYNTINIPIMFYINKKGNRILDVECMTQHFEDRIDDVIMDIMKNGNNKLFKTGEQ